MFYSVSALLLWLVIIIALIAAIIDCKCMCVYVQEIIRSLVGTLGI